MTTAAEVVWDLEALYSDAEAWEKDFKLLDAKAAAFAAYRGRLSESPAVLAQAITASDDFDRLAEKLYSYAHLRSDEDTSVGKNRSRVDRISAKFAELAPQETWFDPEVMAIPDEVMERFLASPELSFYRRSLLELLREKPHTLSEPEERLLGTISDVLGTSDGVFSTLNDTDLTFGTVRDAAGKRVELTHGTYLRLMESADRELRKKTFHKLYGAYRKFRNTFAATLDGTLKRHAVSAKIRHYPSALCASLSGDNVPESVYRNLISTVRAGLPGLFDYLELRRETLHLEKLDMFDLYNPLTPECSLEYSFSDAEKLVKSALHPLGKEYLSILNKAFTERWIDAPERKGKRSGAYSGGCFDSYPYILMNFNGTLNDVFTLAHELGHSMHSYHSNHAQEYHYADYEIFVAEVASTTNELLLSEHLLETNRDPRFRAYLYAHLADEIRATIFRQTMFAEFELQMHELAEQGTPLTADLLCEKYYEINRDYYGPRITADQDIELEWARIPHFYYNFYVYKYATGMSAAIQLASGLRSGEPAKREAYLGFLRAGDSKDVLDIMRDAGVDLSTPAPVEAAMAYFREVTTKLRAELAKIR